MFEDINRVIEEVKKYHQHWRHSERSPLVVSGLYSLFPNKTTVKAKYMWGAPFPSDDKPGSYQLYGPNVNLLYVGKADSLCKRLSQYFVDRDGGCFIKNEDWWSERPSFITTVAVEEKFEAVALEAYLIERLDPRPPDNGRRKKTIDADLRQAKEAGVPDLE